MRGVVHSETRPTADAAGVRSARREGLRDPWATGRAPDASIGETAKTAVSRHEATSVFRRDKRLGCQEASQL